MSKPEVKHDPALIVEAMMSLTEAVNLHVGKVVRLVTSIENNLIQVIATNVNRDSPELARRLIEGRRLNDLISSAKLTMPHLTDLPQLARALQQVGDYRDFIAHASDLFGQEDFDKPQVSRRLERRRRVARDERRLGVEEMHAAYMGLGTVSGIVFNLMVAVIWRPLDEYSTILEAIDALYASPEVLSDFTEREALARILETGKVPGISGAPD